MNRIFTAICLCALAGAMAAERSRRGRGPGRKGVLRNHPAPAGRLLLRLSRDGVDKGGLSFDAFHTLADVLAQPERWEKIWHSQVARLMPPSGRKQPKPEERERLRNWIEQSVFYATVTVPTRVGSPCAG